MSSERAINPETGEERVDCISLETYPEEFDVVVGGTHHDARALAKYIVSGGTDHPLTRIPFTYEDCRTIWGKIPKSMQDELWKSKYMYTDLETLNEKIKFRMALYRLYMILKAIKDDAPKMKAFLEFASHESERMRDNGESDDVLESLIMKVRDIVRDHWERSLPATGGDVMSVLSSTDRQRKLAFMDRMLKILNPRRDHVPMTFMDRISEIVPEMDHPRVEVMVSLFWMWHNVVNFAG
jgi:hypothetical protein